LPDIVVPNSADTNAWESANPAPLAGTEPLITELGIGANEIATNGTSTGSKVALRLQMGTHTAILNSDPTNLAEALPQAATFEAIGTFMATGTASVPTAAYQAAIAP
jgi:hypothetical protein